MTPQPDKCREAFEQRIKDKYPSISNLSKKKIGGEYKHWPVQDRWVEWQAAWNAALRAPAVQREVVDVCPAWFEDLASDFGVQRTEAADFLDAICREYPRIVKEKQP